MHDHQVWSRPLQTLQDARRGIPAAVVDDDDLVIVAELLEHPLERGDAFFDVRLLVVSGDDDGQRSGPVIQ